MLAARAEGGRLPAPAILELLLEALGPIWADRLVIDGVPLGDCWRHPAIRRDDASDGLVPLHKLSQWLAYSLIEPLEEAGIEVVDIDGLTGLAEYRNGGLFVDTGVLGLADPAAAGAAAPGLGPADRRLAGDDRRPARPAGAPGARAARRERGRTFPLARMLEGGSWIGRPPHRRRAPRRRRAPFHHHQRRNGILDMDGLTIVSHPLVQHKLTILRDRTSSIQLFRTVVREIATLLCYEVTRDLPTDLVRVETPIAVDRGAGDRRQEAGHRADPARRPRHGRGHARPRSPRPGVAHIGLYREPVSLQCVEYYFKTPEDFAERLVIIVDPMMATGHTAIAAIDRLKEAGVSDMRFVCLLASRPGAEAVRAAHPDVPIWAAAMDEELNDHGYIVPGLGDAGDRTYGTR